MEQPDPANVEDQEQRPSSPHSDASTISCPNSPEPEVNQDSSLEELASIQEQLQTVLEYVDHGMILKSFDTLSHLTDIVAANCERLGKGCVSLCVPCHAKALFLIAEDLQNNLFFFLYWPNRINN